VSWCVGVAKRLAKQGKVRKQGRERKEVRKEERKEERKRGRAGTTSPMIRSSDT